VAKNSVHDRALRHTSFGRPPRQLTFNIET
jgi:hypothetical protein